MKAVLRRVVENNYQTLGRLTIDNGTEEVFKCVTLELPDKDNQNNISCIPSGDYICKKRYSDKYKWHYHVTDVDGRDWILIHWGNYYTQTKGCILIGQTFAYINGDDNLDVTASRNTVDKLNGLGLEEFELTILDIT